MQKNYQICAYEDYEDVFRLERSQNVMNSWIPSQKITERMSAPKAGDKSIKEGMDGI